MIRKVRISNFKSVQELEIELGRLNVFIGENGCGKTSILEGIAMGSAAAQDKLDEEFLVSRGIRVVERLLMKSAFEARTIEDAVYLNFSTEELDDLGFFIDKPNDLLSKWDIIRKSDTQSLKESGDISIRVLKMLELEIAQNGDDEVSRVDRNKKITDFLRTISSNSPLYVLEKSMKDYISIRSISPLQQFLLFAPENHFLRRFEEEGQIRPLGIRGEGLFRHLVELSKEEPETFKTIADQLSLIDWYDGLSIPTDLSFTERRISIRDRFIEDTIKDFDQRSANEGFLYLLFYFTLFISKYTPGFFAIDNIDNALNPKLCAKLVSVLAQLSAEHNKQAILTTHNPAVLDGLDLNDDEQRLFVIYRNADGETAARRVMPPKKVEGVETVRLSEAFVRGYLGGLPQNF